VNVEPDVTSLVVDNFVRQSIVPPDEAVNAPTSAMVSVDVIENALTN